MKKIRLLVIFGLILVSLFALFACDGKPTLDTPTRPTVEMTTLTLKWRNVPDVKMYTIEITPEGKEPYEMISSKNYYSLGNLDPGSYSLRVRARGKEDESRDSAWSESVSFVREAESGLAFTLNPDGKSYTLSSKGTATGDIVIPDTYRTLPVTAIGKNAFFNKSDVYTVTFGENTNVESIGAFAFGNCSYLTSVNLPAGLTSIGENAFASCRLLDGALVIPDGIEVIPKSAFAYCGSIDSLILGTGVKRIEQLAFTACTSLKEVTLPDSVEYVGEYAFSLCSALDTLSLGSGLETIDKYAFSSLHSLAGVSVPDSVSVIEEGAFYDCTTLASVTLGDGIASIGGGAFASTPIWTAESSENEVYVGKWFLGLRDASVAALNLRADTVGIASLALYMNENISVVQLPNSVKTINYEAFALSNLTTVVIGYGVREIGEQAFGGCQNLSKVVLGSFDDDTAGIEASSLERIGDSAFRNCTVLDSIDMPSTLKVVGSYAFRDSGIYKSAEGVVYAGNWVVDYNDQITDTVEIADGTVGVANYAFISCTALTDVRFPASLKVLGRAAFYNCSELRTVALPATLSVIEDYTFYRCTSLRLFTLPPMLTYIGRSAFYKCGSGAAATEGDTENDVLTIPSGVTYIGDYAFYSCVYSEKASISEEEYYNYYGIDMLVLGESVEYLGANAFSGCSSLTLVYLGGTVTLGEKAFYKCERLFEVHFGTRLADIGEKAFYKCTLLGAAYLPDTVKTVGSYAFYRCESLQYLTLGSVESIGSYAFFGNTSLEKLSLPTSVDFIGKQAFRNCRKLKSVVLPTGIDEIQQHAFYGTSELTVYVEGDAIPTTWHKQWNSSYRPVITGCVLSEDKTYVLYVIKTDIINLNSSNAVSDPARDNYAFEGWGTSATATVPSHTSANISEAANGTRLYAIWRDLFIYAE